MLCVEVAFLVHHCWEALGQLWVLDLPRSQRSVNPVKKETKRNFCDPGSSALEINALCEKSAMQACLLMSVLLCWCNRIKISATLEEIQVSSLIWG